MQRRATALLGSALFLTLAPGTIAGLVPWWITRWQRGVLDLVAFGKPLAIMLGLAGALVLIESFVRFAWQGYGTPAPIAPPHSLIVSGPYRHVRNPMYLAVIALILAQALWLARAELLAYAAGIAIAFHLFVIGYEEPGLARRYGDTYRQYRAHVPRWLPRVSPWHQ